MFYQSAPKLQCEAKKAVLLGAGENNYVEFFESHSVPSTNEELADQKSKEAQCDKTVTCS